MKKLFFLLLASTLTLMTFSCKDDDEGMVELKHDGENFSAPELPQGTFDAGVRFPKTITKTYEGYKLKEIDFYIQEKPSTVEVIVYGEGSASSPGSEELYRKNVTTAVTANSWTLHTLDTPVEIKNEDIWIVVRLVQNGSLRSIGCDEGPANSNGDWMLGEGSTEWRTYRNISNNVVNVNWNIRGNIYNE